MKARCVMMVIDKRQDALVYDKLCDNEILQQYVQNYSLFTIFFLYTILFIKKH